MQILRGRSGPLRRGPLGLIDRLSLIEAFLNWSFVYLYKFAGIFVPAAYLLFGVKAVQVSLFELLAMFLPYYLVHAQVMSWFSRGRVVPILTDVGQFLTAPAALKAVAIGLLRPIGQKFKVTAKGGDRAVRFLEWPLLKIFLSLLVMAIFAVLYAFTFSSGRVVLGEGALALVWSWYNIIALSLLCVICIEQPRRRRAGRFLSGELATVFVAGHRRVFAMRDVSVSGAQFEGMLDANPGDNVLVRFGDAQVPGKIVRATTTSFAVRFENSLRARVVLVRHIFSAVQDRAIHEVRTAPIAGRTRAPDHAIGEPPNRPLFPPSPLPARRWRQASLLGLGQLTNRLGARLGEEGGLGRIARHKARNRRALDQDDEFPSEENRSRLRYP